MARPLTFLLGILVALGAVIAPLAPASAETTSSAGLQVTDVTFANESFPDGTRQNIAIAWKLDADAETPVRLVIDLPDALRGFDDNIAMLGPDGEQAGLCEARSGAVTCTVADDFVMANEKDISGTFTFQAATTFKNRTEISEEITVAGITNTVIIGANPNWCLSNCALGAQGLAKWGSYNNLNDEIVWTIRIPASAQGMEPGQRVAVTDLLAEQGYELIEDSTYPRVLEGNTIGVDEWGRDYVRYRTITDGVEWNGETVAFTTRPGPGQDSAQDEGIRGTDGSFYQVQVKVAVGIPGTVNANGDRVFTNKASYTIEDEDPKDIAGSTTRYSGSATVVGRNFGRFAVTKELTGNTTLNPEFTISYTVTEPGSEADTRTAKITAGGTFTSPEFFRGTTVTIEEITPTEPANVTWADPVFVDAAGNPVTELTFSGAERTLGTTTALRLRNVATLNTGTFQAQKVVENPEGVSLPEDLAFRLDYSYSADAAQGFPAGSGHLDLSADGTVATSTALPVGAVLTLSEATPASIAGATWSAPEVSPSTLTIGESDDPALITVTNELRQDLGGFSVAKAISGEGADLVPEGAEFTVRYSYTGVNGFSGGSDVVTVKAGEVSEPVTGIPAGAVVTLEEVAPVNPLGGTWGEPKFDLSTFTVVKDQIVEISLDNPISWNDGDFSAAKVIEGDGAGLVPADTPFTIEYSYTLPEALGAEERTGEDTLVVRADGEIVTSKALPYGTEVTLSEAAPAAIPGGTWTGARFDQESFTIGDETTIEIVLSNEIERDLGAFSLTKTVSGSGAHLVDPDTAFTIAYSYPAGPGFEAGEGSVAVAANGEPALVESIPAQAVVTLTEETPSKIEGGTWQAPVFTPGAVLTVAKDETAEIGIDNPIDLNTGQFAVTKQVTGSGADLVDESTGFTVEYAYEAGEGFEAGSGSLEVLADGTAVTSEALPYGAVVQLRELRPAEVTGAEWTGHSFSQDTVTIGDGSTVSVVLTNELEADVPPSPGAEAPGSGGKLPRTGMELGALFAGLLLIAAGSAVVWRARRRRV